jgi:hypothetical protein
LLVQEGGGGTGEVTEVNEVEKAGLFSPKEEQQGPFIGALGKHPWSTLAFNSCKQVILASPFDFMAGSTFPSK